MNKERKTEGVILMATKLDFKTKRINRDIKIHLKISEERL
jgi:hypothetical protein